MYRSNGCLKYVFVLIYWFLEVFFYCDSFKGLVVVLRVDIDLEFWVGSFGFKFWVSRFFGMYVWIVFLFMCYYE